MTERTGRIIFVIGGAKSGKSSFVLEKAGAFPGKKAYLATAQPLDDEMREKIERHKAQRGKDWDTFSACTGFSADRLISGFQGSDDDTCDRSIFKS